LKTEKKPIPNWLLFYKKSKKSMEPMLELKSLFNKLSMPWASPMQKKLRSI